MASPPFSIAETTPQDTAVASAFPATERTYRDTVESWLLAISTVYGYGRVPVLNTTQRDTETNWAAGNMIYNTTLARLQAVVSIGPVVWGDALSSADNFPSGTRMLFQQTSAPTGWTKESSATYEDVAIKNTTGSVGTGGTVAFATAFASQAVVGVVGDHALSISEIPSHTHDVKYTLAGYGGGAVNAVNFVAPSGSSTGSAAAIATGGSGTHTHTFAGTAINLAVKYASVIIAQKN